jgi:hypothetical protein
MEYVEIAVAGAKVKVPSGQINGKTVIVSGRWLKTAVVKDEDWQEGDVVLSPDEFLANSERYKSLGADLFTFSQKPNDTSPRFPFVYEWDSVAAIPVVSYSEWWTNQVGSYLRRDVRKAAKCNVVVREVPFSDDLVRGILDIYDETPIRQGVPFWHYQKGFEAARIANATYMNRSDFVGAFVGDELIGFVKIVYVDKLARLMQVLSKEKHRDKRAMNALLAKAVELCDRKHCTHLTYGKYCYSQGADSLTAFKHRNGFEEILVPKYYVPLTARGRVALRLRLQNGPKELVPDSVLRLLKRVRASVYRRMLPATKVL